MSQFTWIKGMDSPNKTGRPRGSKRNFKRELERFSARKGTVKELLSLYDRLKEPALQFEMLKAIWSYTIPKPSVDTISTDEIDRIYDLLKQAANNETKASKAS